MLPLLWRMTSLLGLGANYLLFLLFGIARSTPKNDRRPFLSHRLLSVHGPACQAFSYIFSGLSTEIFLGKLDSISERKSIDLWDDLLHHFYRLKKCRIQIPKNCIPNIMSESSPFLSLMLPTLIWEKKALDFNPKWQKIGCKNWQLCWRMKL